MIKEMNEACGRLNKALGVSVTLPELGEKELKAAAARNFAIGAALTAAGVVFSSKWCVVLGGAGMAGGVMLRREAGHMGE